MVTKILRFNFLMFMCVNDYGFIKFTISMKQSRYNLRYKVNS